MPVAEKYDSRVRRGCAKGASKLRLKSSTDAERSEGAAKILFCRGYRPRAGGLYLTKQGRPRKPTAKKAGKRRSVKNGVSHTYGETVADFRRGTRVELRPGMDRWMFGDKYGDVTQTSRKSGRVRVKLDRSGDSIWFFPSQLRIEEF